MEFRIFNENIGLAPSQTLLNSGKIPTPSPGDDVSVESRPSTEVATSDLQVSASQSIILKDDVSANSETTPNVESGSGKQTGEAF